MYVESAFGLSIQSDFPLPVLQTCGREADICVQIEIAFKEMIGWQPIEEATMENEPTVQSSDQERVRNLDESTARRS
jgi:hypothetical protein